MLWVRSAFVGLSPWIPQISPDCGRSPPIRAREATVFSFVTKLPALHHRLGKLSRPSLAGTCGAGGQEIASGCPSIPGGVRVGAAAAACLVAIQATVAPAIAIAVWAGACGLIAHRWRRGWGGNRLGSRRGSTCTDVQECIGVAGPHTCEGVQHSIVEQLCEHCGTLLGPICLKHERSCTRHMRASH